MTFSFQAEAESEFLDAVDFYEASDAGLGEAFAEDVFATIRRILRFPESWPKYSFRSQRCLCSRFPYSIIYRIRDGEVVIYALMHHRRRPGYWKNRR